MGFRWIVDPVSAFMQGFSLYVGQILDIASILANKYAPLIENWMKENALWKDRSGNARQSLWAETRHLGQSIEIAFGHGVEYGVWLETRYQGKYSIIGPALDHFTPLIWAELERAIQTGTVEV